MQTGKAIRISNERIEALQLLLSELCGLAYTSEQAQEAGAAIVRFVAAKAQREHELVKNKDNEHGK